MTGLLRGWIWNERSETRVWNRPLAGDPQQVSHRQDFHGTFDCAKIIFLTKETLFSLCSLHCLGVVDFLEGDALQANLQLAILLGPWITDMSSQETLGPHKPEYFSSSLTELKTAMILVYIHVVLPDTLYRVSVGLSVEP